ncbi:hypothetical protein GCM10010428_39470 [Actinosynnema pretiosum subsp. pretiosum]
MAVAARPVPAPAKATEPATATPAASPPTTRRAVELCFSMCVSSLRLFAGNVFRAFEHACLLVGKVAVSGTSGKDVPRVPGGCPPVRRKPVGEFVTWVTNNRFRVLPALSGTCSGG